MTNGRRRPLVNEHQVSGMLGWNYLERMALGAGTKPIQVKQELDNGIDAYIEYGDVDNVRMVAVQVKRGGSYFDKSGPRVQTDEKHLRRWVGHQLPVILVVVSEGEEAYWMNVTEYLHRNPEVVTRGPYVLRPPVAQVFSERVLLEDLDGMAAKVPDFGESVGMLCSDASETRRSATPGLYRHRDERRTVFCLAAALRAENDPVVLGHWCNFYSRYLFHPEGTFDVQDELAVYAQQLLAEAPRAVVRRILSALEEDAGDFGGATVIFELEDDEDIWERTDVFERGTDAQGVAEVLRTCTSPEMLFEIWSDDQEDLWIRRDAVAVYTYLGYSCPLDLLEGVLAQNSPDGAMRALLVWLRHWLIDEGQSNTASAEEVGSSST